jgi:hypothetical protein
MKGTLDMLVLKALKGGPMHGFEITTWLEAESAGALDGTLLSPHAAGAPSSSGGDEAVGAVRRHGDAPSHRRAPHGLIACPAANCLRACADSFGSRCAHRATRRPRRAPSFTLVVVCCLALAIGGNVAIYSVLDGVLLKLLPVARPDELVRGWNDGVVAAGVFDIVAGDQHAYSHLGAFEAPRAVTVIGAGEPQRLQLSLVTVDFFRTLGVQAAIGRTFTADDR